MKFTAADVKTSLVWEPRIFFVSEFSEQEEVRYVLDYEATAEKLNQIKAEVPTKTDYYNSIIKLQDEKLARAERALLRAGFQDLGGEEWKPPVNEAAGELFRLKEMLRRIVE